MGSPENIFQPKPATTEGTSVRERLTLSSGSRTEKKEAHEVNQDALLYDPKNMAFGVFDGMGGHKAGEVASSLARTAIQEYMEDSCKDDMPIDEIQKIIKEAFDAGHQAILEDLKTHSERDNMGTTGTVLKIHNDSEGNTWGVIGHVGDSRIYVSDSEGFRQITTDDDYVAQAGIDKARAKLIRHVIDNAERESDVKGIAKEPFNYRNVVTKALGRPSYTEPTIIIFRIIKGAKIVIVSDGVNTNLITKKIQSIVEGSEGAQKISDKLVEESVKASKDKTNFRHHEDDISAIAVAA